MAGGWGSSHNGVKIGCFWDGIELSADGSQARITDARVEIDRSVNIVDSTNKLTVSGGAVTDDSWSNLNVGGSGSERIKSVGESWHTLTYGATSTATFSASLSGVDYAGQTLSNSETVTYPARAYSVPNAPWGLTASRNNDNNFYLSWNNNPTTAAPYVNVRVDRAEFVNNAWGAWTNVAVLGVVNAWTDTGTVADRVYTWRVVATNTTGWSGYNQSAGYGTTPNVPTSLNAVRATDGQINLSWANASAITSQNTIYIDRWDNVSNAWTTIAGIGGAETSYAAVGLVADRKYSFRVVVTSYNLWSGYTYSGYVTTSPATPSNAVATFVSDSAIDLTWVNNSTLDNSIVVHQSVNGGAWTEVTTLTGNPTSYRVTTSANNKYQFRIIAVNLVGPTLYSAWTYTNLVGTTPAAPTACAASYVSDNQINVTWTNVSTIASNVLLERNEGSSWNLIATLNADTIAYQDWSTVGDKRYAYRVRAVNLGAYSSYSISGDVATTPNAPSNVVATKDGTNITVTWTNNSAVATGFIVYDSSNGNWTYKGEPAGTSYTDTTANPAYTHRYDVFTKNGSRNSGAATSNTVQLLTPPLAPTVTLDKTVVDINLSGITVSWVHNPLDSTVQAAAEIRFSVLGANAWTTLSNTTAAVRALDYSVLHNGNTYEVQVRTKGGHANFGDWSASKIVVASAIPSVTITSPSVATITDSAKLTATWTYFDSEGTAQVAWIARLKKSGVTVEEKNGTTGTSYAFNTPLVNNSSYTVEVLVQDGSSLWSNTATKAFATDFVDPPTPDLELSYNEAEGLVYINIVTPAAGEGEAEPIYVDVYRDNVLIASNLELASSTIDYVPPLNKTVTYKAVTWSALPTSTAGEASVATPCSEWVFINGGNGFAQVARLKGNPAVDVAVGRTKVLHTFAGRTKPVEYVGTARSRVYRLSGDVAGFASKEAELGSWEAFEAVADLPAPLVYRDPLGRKVYVSIGEVDISHAASSDLASISCELTEVDYNEG